MHHLAAWFDHTLTRRYGAETLIAGLGVVAACCFTLHHHLIRGMQ